MKYGNFQQIFADVIIMCAINRYKGITYIPDDNYVYLIAL